MHYRVSYGIYFTYWYIKITCLGQVFDILLGCVTGLLSLYYVDIMTCDLRATREL